MRNSFARGCRHRAQSGAVSLHPRRRLKLDQAI
jgi:hypothetical protein